MPTGKPASVNVRLNTRFKPAAHPPLPATSRSHGRRANLGFTYIGLIVLVAIIALVAASSIKLGALLQRRAAEQDLLEIGAAFSEALRSYAEASAPEQPKSPTTLAQLLRDPRYAAPKRHLRQLYADPMTGQTEWGLVLGPDHRSIIGIHSLSNARPIKLANFAPGFEQLENKAHISDWKFMLPGAIAVPVPPPGLKGLPN